MRYTMAVTHIITTTGSMTVEAANPEEAQEQVKAALEKAWHHDRLDRQGGATCSTMSRQNTKFCAISCWRTRMPKRRL